MSKLAKRGLTFLLIGALSTGAIMGCRKKEDTRPVQKSIWELVEESEKPKTEVSEKQNIWEIVDDSPTKGDSSFVEWSADVNYAPLAGEFEKIPIKKVAGHDVNTYVDMFSPLVSTNPIVTVTPKIIIQSPMFDSKINLEAAYAILSNPTYKKLMEVKGLTEKIKEVEDKSMRARLIRLLSQDPNTNGAFTNETEKTILYFNPAGVAKKEVAEESLEISFKRLERPPFFKLDAGVVIDYVLNVRGSEANQTAVLQQRIFAPYIPGYDGQWFDDYSGDQLLISPSRIVRTNLNRLRRNGSLRLDLYAETAEIEGKNKIKLNPEGELLEFGVNKIVYTSKSKEIKTFKKLNPQDRRYLIGL